MQFGSAVMCRENTVAIEAITSPLPAANGLDFFPRKLTIVAHPPSGDPLPLPIRISR